MDLGKIADSREEYLEDAEIDGAEVGCYLYLSLGSCIRGSNSQTAVSPEGTEVHVGCYFCLHMKTGGMVKDHRPLRWGKQQPMVGFWGILKQARVLQKDGRGHRLEPLICCEKRNEMGRHSSASNNQLKTRTGQRKGGSGAGDGHPGERQ
eukprot:10826656-Ditylum_brightwellii.AAC.1